VHWSAWVILLKTMDAVTAAAAVQREYEVKCVSVGDGAVGKTSMLISYTENKFPEDYVPTVFDNHGTLLKYDGKEIQFSLWDTAGQEGYARIRTLSYPKTDIFLACFSVVDRTSYENIKNRWLPEVEHHCPGVLTMLVGLKIDLREDEETVEEMSARGEAPVTTEEGVQYADSLGLAEYLECSALTREGLDKVFQTALVRVVKRKYGVAGGDKSDDSRKRRPTCALL